MKHTQCHIRSPNFFRGPAVGAHSTAWAGPSLRSPGVLGTLSECLFFFGIYSSHFGGTRKAHVFQFLEAATPSIPYRTKRKKNLVSVLLPGSLPSGVSLSHCTFGLTPPPTYLAHAIWPKTVHHHLKCHSEPEPDAYGHTTGNAPEPVRFQKLSLVRPS